MIIGIDLGGTQLRAGWVQEDVLSSIRSEKINAKGSTDEILQQLFSFIDAMITPGVEGIGMGVPGLVDASTGLVYDVVNIPAWKEIPLQYKLQERYKLPVVVDNDANCFALGEFYFGKGKGFHSMVGVTLGTGLGSGIILNNKLYTGANGGAGEFGAADYLDHSYEYYASGQFFQNVYGIDGETVFKQASEGQIKALNMYAQMGEHLGKALKSILYALDVELIVFGGSVRKAYPFFNKTMWQQLNTFAYKKCIDRLQVHVSELENSGLLGAAALVMNRTA